MAKLGAIFEGIKNQAENQGAIVSSKLKEAIGDFLQSDFEQNRNVFLIRKGRRLRIVSSLEGLDVARDRIELPTRGFSVLVP